MIDFEPALRPCKGYYFYLRLEASAWTKRPDIRSLSKMEDICEQFCQNEYGLSLAQARANKFLELDLSYESYWIISVSNIEELSKLANVFENFNGTAFYVKNEIHFENIKRFTQQGVVALPREQKTDPTYWVYLSAAQTASEQVDWIVEKYQDAKSFKYLSKYILCFDNEELLFLVKMKFPNIIKIEKMINPDEIGEKQL